jgi:pyruvate,water dikinase
MIGVHPDEHTDLAAGVRALQDGRLAKADFLARFGHRGSQEMELSKPRWSEDAAAVERMSSSPLPLYSGGEGPGVRGEEAWRIAWLKLADDARLLPSQRPAVEAELHRLQRYMALRETAKHHMLRGYALIRRALVELDGRFKLDGGIFFLTPNLLPDLIEPKGESGSGDYEHLIEGRRQERKVALSLPVPMVLFSDDLDAIGREPALAEGAALQGVPLSAGIVEANAWVVEDIANAQMPHEPYILVCPSTDPAWVPLFVHARGVVMETGGMLSHGAIVAREFGLPAVAGIADVQRRIKTGQRLRIDGGTGMVSVLG